MINLLFVLILVILFCIYCILIILIKESKVVNPVTIGELLLPIIENLSEVEQKEILLELKEK